MTEGNWSNENGAEMAEMQVGVPLVILLEAGQRRPAY